MTFHPETVEYMFSRAHGTFSRMGHIVSQKKTQKNKKTPKKPQNFEPGMLFSAVKQLNLRSKHMCTLV